MDEFKRLTQIEHILHRPDMYISSITTEKDTKWVCYHSGEVEEAQVDVNPGFLKLFDEIISNSADEHKRNNKLNLIQVKIDLNSSRITIRDNGGIPVKTKEDWGGAYIPEVIFSELFTGSNFDDTKERITVGTNGLGSVLTNIYSKEFKVDTSDGSLRFTQIYKNNMSEKSVPEIVKSKSNFTEISYIPDLEKFKLESIPEDFVNQLRKRSLDVAASNPNLKVIFEVISDDTLKNEFQFKDFFDYVKCYTVSDDVISFEIRNKRADIVIVHSKKGFYHKSFVNSVDTFEGGTHVRYVEAQISEFCRDWIKKKTKYDIKPSDIRNHYAIFMNCLVTNPRFKGQTKEILSTGVRDMGCDLDIPEKILKLIVKSEITASIMDWVESKKAADEKAEMRKLNKEVGGSLPVKLIDANARNRNNTILYIMEGASAASAVRKLRDPQVHGCYPLRGKFMNVLELSNTDVAKNAEVQGLCKSIGLKLGENALELVEPSGNKVKIKLNDTIITVDENEEILIDSKWVLVKDLMLKQGVTSVKETKEVNKSLNNKGGLF